MVFQKCYSSPFGSPEVHCTKMYNAQIYPLLPPHTSVQYFVSATVIQKMLYKLKALKYWVPIYN